MDVGAQYNVILRASDPAGQPICEEILKTQQQPTKKIKNWLCTGLEKKLKLSETYYLAVEKRTEALFGISKFLGFEFENPSVVVSQKKENDRKKRIEFIGGTIFISFRLALQN